MKTDLKTLCTLLYGLFLAGAAMQFSFATIIVGTVALVAAVVILYRERKRAAGTPFETHFTWLLRTFWIGTGVYLPVLTVAATAVLCNKVDMNAIADKMSAEGTADLQGIEAILMAQYGTLFNVLIVSCSLPFMAWWLWRCWKGYAALKAGKPVEKVTSWI